MRFVQYVAVKCMLVLHVELLDSEHLGPACERQGLGLGRGTVG